MLNITVTKEPSISGVIVKLDGAATMDTADKLERQLTALTAAHPVGVIIDASTLTMLTSICIGQLVTFRKSIIRGTSPSPEAPAGRVALAGANPNIFKSMKFSRLDEIFEIFPSVDAAKAALAHA